MYYFTIILICDRILLAWSDFMFRNFKILDEKDSRIRQVSDVVSFPIGQEEKKTIKDVMTYLRYSQIEKYAKKYNLRAGWGMSAIQIGIKKRWFVIVEEQEDHTFKEYFFANPRIISNSTEQIYDESGEGCLSVNREVPGIVLRSARITVEAYDIDGNRFQARYREDLAVCIQHELDHLNGILFVDKINKKNPFNGKDKYRSI